VPSSLVALVATHLAAMDRLLEDGQVCLEQPSTLSPKF